MNLHHRTSRPLGKTTRAAEGLDRRPFTVRDVERMFELGLLDEDERVELIGGELVPMSAKGNRHEILKTELLKRWYRRLPETIDITPETTVRFSDDTYLEPDVVVYEKAHGLAGLSGGSVLLVVEIADSSRRYDTGRKATIYAGFGVRELWVIDAVRTKIRVFRDPSPEGYRDVRDVPAKEAATPRFAPDVFALRLADLDLQ